MLKLNRLSSVLLFAGALALTSADVLAETQTPAVPVQAGGVPSLAPIIEKVLPAVVTINVEGSKEVSGGGPESFPFFFGDPFGFNPFDGGHSARRPFKALGSGVIVDAKEGYIVTNNHVVDDAKKITITTHDGRQFDAKKIGADPQSDVALLKIEGDHLTAVPYADSDELRVGDYAIAVGNPFGLGHTVTYGIISALGRSVDGGGNQFENYIQTDAAINQGNSGGSLIDLKGNLIGINTAIIAPSGGNVGIGFAIPSNMVKSITEQLIKFGEVRRGFLGIMGGELTPDLAEKFGASQNKGAFVNQVMEGSAADEAGLKAGDIIVSLNGHKIASFSELRARIATVGSGSTVTLGIIRDGKEISKKVTLKTADKRTVETSSKEVNAMFEGVQLANATGKVQGAEIVSIDKKSNAARYGLQKGDVIVGVNREKVESVEDLNRILSKSKGTQALNVIRGNMNMFIIIR